MFFVVFMHPSPAPSLSLSLSRLIFPTHDLGHARSNASLSARHAAGTTVGVPAVGSGPCSLAHAAYASRADQQAVRPARVRTGGGEGGAGMQQEKTQSAKVTVSPLRLPALFSLFPPSRRCTPPSAAVAAPLVRLACAAAPAPRSPPPRRALASAVAPRRSRRRTPLCRLAVRWRRVT